MKKRKNTITIEFICDGCGKVQEPEIKRNTCSTWEYWPVVPCDNCGGTYKPEVS
jgi:hypothetical protein